MKRHLPNLLTLANLVVGVAAVVSLFQSPEIPVAWFVWACCVFDFLDGFTARLLKVSSPIGKELDSLADVVSFGMVPALYLFLLLQSLSSHPLVPYVALLMAALSALRLAIFNVDTSQSDSFRGLNTPANTLFVTSLGLLPPTLKAYIFHEWVIVIIAVVFSLLLVSNLRFFAFKFKSFGWAGNELRYSFVVLSTALLLIFGAGGITLIILSYILISGGAALIGRSV